MTYRTFIGMLRQQQSDTHYNRWSRLAGWFVILAGAAVRIGWWLELPLFKKGLPDFIMTKPATSLAFVLGGAALVLLSKEDARSGRVWTVRILTIAMMLLAGLTLAQYCFGLQLRFDSLLFRDNPEILALFVPGRMAPATTVLFLAIGLALLLIDWEPRPLFRPSETLSLLVLGLGLFSLTQYFFETPLLDDLYRRTRPALLTSVVFVVLAHGLLFARPDRGWVGALWKGSIGRKERRWLFLTPLGLVLLLVVGCWLYNQQKQSAFTNAAAELESVGRLKMEQILNWRAERLGDGRALVNRPAFIAMIERWSSIVVRPPQLEERIRAELEPIRTSYKYSDILLVDVHHHIKFSLSGKTGKVTGELAEVIVRVSQSGKSELSDLYFNKPERAIVMDVVVPVFSSTASTPLGFVLFRIDPSTELYRITQSWPTPTRTGEILLARRDKDGILFLNELRRRPNAALSLRVPLTNTDLPMVQAALGHEGIIIGKDYAEVPVVASAHRIPGSSWLLVDKLDVDEIAERWRTSGLLTVAVVSLLAVFLIGSMIIIRIQRQRYLDLQVAEKRVREEEERFRAMFADSPDPYLIMELPNGAISDCNKAAEETLRGKREMIIGKTPDEVSPRYQPNGQLSSKEVVDRIRETLENGGHHFEWVGQRFDGTDFWVDVAISVVRMAGRQSLFVTLRDITERKRAEAALKESRQQLLDIIDFLPDATFVVDENKVVIAWNKAMEEMTGVRAEEIIGQGNFAYAIPFYGERRKLMIDMLENIDCEFEKKYRNFQCKGNTINAEVFVPSVYQGKGAHVWVTAAPLYNTSGERIGAIEAIRDISYRKKMEVDLQEARNRLSTVVTTIPDLIWMKDTEGVYLACNPEFEQFLGAPESEIIGKTDYEFIDSSLADFFRQKDQEAIETGETRIDEEVVIYRSDGRRILLETRKVPVTDADGRTVGVLGIGRDITKRKQAEEDLRKSEERLRSLANEQQTIIDTAHVGITKVQNRIQIWCNQAMAEMFGYSRDELLNASTSYNFPTENSYSQLRMEAYPNLTEGKVFETERQMRRKDGTLVWVHMTGKAINPDDLSEGSVWTFEDVSARKEYEQNLNEAKRVAESANRAKGEFLANMSHEIRTPLNGIIGLTHLMLDSSVNPKLRDYLAKIRTSSNSLMQVLNDVLDYSKIEAGQLMFDMAPFHIDKVLSRISDLFSVMAEEKGLELSFEVAPSLPACFMGDEIRLGQVLNNLVGNAIKFTHKGEIHIKIDPVETMAEEAVIAFAVRDSGIGISEDDLEKLFSAFTQADSSTTRKYGGTGLGLSISKKLVELMGGGIWVTSTPGEGSTFTFTARLKLANNLPLVRDQGVEPHSVAGLLAKARPVHGARVLLVEDNTINRQVARELLERFGFIVETADNGREAVQLVEHNKYDIILMDLQMTEMDGFEATRIIRASHDDKQLPIIAMTAAAMKEEREACLAAGMNDHIPKPLEPENVLDMLILWIKPSSERDYDEEKPTLYQGGGVPFTVSGFDTEYAAACQLGNWNVVRRALDSFTAEFGDAESKLKALLSAENFKDAAMLIHSVKGSSANLGGMQLAKAAGVLETELNTGISTSLPEFCLQLGKAVEAIRLLEQPTRQSSPYDRDAVTGLLSNIVSLVQSHRIVPHEMIENLCSMLSESSVSLQSRKLRDNLDRFAYAEAMETARCIAEILNLELEK